MVIDISKVRPKHLFLFFVFTFVPCLVALLLYLMNFTAAPYGSPREFAVDNEQRIYMSFDSGLYVVANDRFVLLLPEERYGYALSVSDDDMLTIAGPMNIRIIDLAKSDLASGHMDVVQMTTARDNALFDILRENWETDPQNGITYRLLRNSYYYEILREDKDGSSVFFRKPYSNDIWNYLARNSLIFLTLYLGAEILFIHFYVKRHPEIQKQASDSSEIRKRQ